MEVSHRSQTFQDVIDSAMSRLRRLIAIPDDYEVLFLQGGASTQFYMSALNLMSEGGMADYLVTGIWSKKALVEANRIGDASAVWDDSDSGFRSVPRDGDYSVRDGAEYLHYTSNNTLFGTQFHHLPIVAASQGSRRQLGHLRCQDRRFGARSDLRWCPEEPRSERSDRGNPLALGV